MYKEMDTAYYKLNKPYLRRDRGSKQLLRQTIAKTFTR